MFRPFFAALTMLTVIPIPGFVGSEKDLERCKPYFPLIGLLVGALTWGVAWLLLFIFPKIVAAIATVVFMTMISKGFHIDGLADTADGFMSSRPRERILEIMHDSHIGTMGVLAMIAVIGIQTAALISLTDIEIPFAAGFAALSGRCAIVIYIYISRYARQSGLGQIMFRHKSVITCLWTMSIWYVIGFSLVCVYGLIAVTLLAIFPCIWSIYTRMKIGGATGDTIGACEILTETLVLLIACMNF